jgi:hypothetical protein
MNEFENKKCSKFVSVFAISSGTSEENEFV